MIVEVWVDTILADKNDEALGMALEWQKMYQKQGIKVQMMQPQTGRLNKLVSVIEWNTYAEREAFWDHLPEEIAASIPKRKELFETDALEHYYYKVVE